jgi:hypothetical protein
VQLRVRGQLDSLSTRRTAAAPPAARKLSSMGPLYGQAVLRATTAPGGRVVQAQIPIGFLDEGDGGLEEFPASSIPV